MEDQAPIRAKKIEALFASKGIKVEIKDFDGHQEMVFVDLGITLRANGDRWDGGWFGLIVNGRAE